MNVLSWVKKQWKIVGLCALFIVLSVGGVMVFHPDIQLASCLKDRGVEYTRENRAAEAAKLGIWGWKDSFMEKINLFNSLNCKQGLLGYGVVTDYQKALSSPMTSSQSFVPVTSLTLKDSTTLSMSVLGNIVFLTLEPGASNEEIVACTAIDSSAKQFTGCTRGLAFSGTSTAAVAANQKTHSSGSTVVMSNVHYVYQQFLDKDGDPQTVTSTVTFVSIPSVTSTTAIPTSNNQLATWYGAQTLIAGGFSSLNVSSTLGLQALTGLSNCSTSGTCVGINASGTGALAFFASTGAAYVNVSSTASDTLGGYLKYTFGTANKIYWDAVSFLSGNHTWSGTQTFNGNVTSTANFDVTTAPVNASDVTNKTYVDNQIAFGQATGTAQVAITAGQALWMSATSSQIMKTNTSVASSTFQFIGIAVNSVSAGATVTYTKPSGINCGQSGLTTGLQYYLNGTAGQISTTAGTFFARIGIAVSTTCIQVVEPKYIVRGIQTSPNSNTSFFVNTGFYPAHIDIKAALTGGGTLSVGDDTNNCIEVGATVDGTISTSNAWQTRSGGNTNIGTVSAKSQYGWTGTNNAANVSATLQYTAYSE